MAKTKTKRVNVFRIILFVLLAGILITGGITAAFVFSAIKEVLPALADLEPKPSQTSFVYDKDGRVWTELHSTENRVLIDLEELPQHVRDAILAAEDHRFYDHIGVDLRAIIRAFVTNLLGDSPNPQGGSTITQQLAKKAFLTDAQSYKRKVQDATAAILLERKYTKDEILEMYLNQVPFGRGAYGIEAGARTFFGKSASELTVPEAAMMAGLLKGPSYYDPTDRPENALARRNTVLEQMAEYGYITAAECEEYKATPINARSGQGETVSTGGWYLDYVLKQLLSKYPAETVYGGGLKIYTAYSPEDQEAAEKAISTVLDKEFPYEGTDSIQAASIVMDARTGYLLAIVGGRNREGALGWNRAIDAKRQPGSSFKPLAVYVPALEEGMGPATVIDDSPVTWTDPVTKEKFSPRNYSYTFQGPVTLRLAVRESLNVVAAKVQDIIGLPKSLEMAERLGITSLVKTPTPDGRTDLTRSLALGGLTYGASPLDMTVAFGVLANRGIKVEPISIIRVEDKNGNVLEEHVPKRELVISEETAYLMTSMLQGAVKEQYGTGRAADIGIPCAGKTGTTSDWKDAWFCGYTPGTVGVVWMGFDQEKTMEQWKITGGSYPARIWKEMMKTITAKQAPEDFVKPGTIVKSLICEKSGLLPGPLCPEEDTVEEMFVKERQPSSMCTFHVPQFPDTEIPGDTTGLDPSQWITGGQSTGEENSGGENSGEGNPGGQNPPRTP
jgi:penicillin-binding protein 1A